MKEDVPRDDGLARGEHAQGDNSEMVNEATSNNFPISFPGDLFGQRGDYTDEDFGWQEEDENTYKEFNDREADEKVIVVSNPLATCAHAEVVTPNQEGDTSASSSTSTPPVTVTTTKPHAEQAECPIYVQCFSDAFPSSTAGAHTA